MSSSLTAQLYLAPLQGVTTRVFRRAYTGLYGGIDKTFSPFLNATLLTGYSAKHLRDILPAPPGEDRLVPQVLGQDPGCLDALITAIEAAGYKEINWNLGCPAREVVKNGRGAGLLPRPDRVDRVLSRLFRKTGRCLSIKTRLGLSDPAELRRLLPVLNSYPLMELIVHARTGAMGYQGTPLYNDAAAVLARAKMPVVYNGDCRTPGDIHRVCRWAPFSGVMLGRGAIRDPLLPRKARGEAVSQGQETDLFRRFHDRLYRAYRSACPTIPGVLGRMKELWGYWPVPDNRWKRAVLRSRTYSEYEQAIDRVFSAFSIG